MLGSNIDCLSNIYDSNNIGKVSKLSKNIASNIKFVFSFIDNQIDEEDRQIRITDELIIDISEVSCKIIQVMYKINFVDLQNTQEYLLKETVDSQPTTTGTSNLELPEVITFTPAISPKRKKRKFNVDNTTNKQKQELHDIKTDILLLKKETQKIINEKLKLELEEKKLDIAIKQKQYELMIANQCNN